jgi:hypothetical protein
MLISRWAKIKQKWSWPLAIIAFTVMFAASLNIYNNLPIEWPLRSSEVERNIHSWLDEAGCSVQTIHDPECRFRFDIIQSYEPVTISNMKINTPIGINMAVLLKMSEGDQKFLATLSEKRRLQFTENLKLELIKIGVSYSFHYGSNGQVQSLDLNNWYFYTKSPNAKTEFYNSISIVVRSVKIAVSRLAELRRGNI